MTPIIKPTVGRVVLYWPLKQERAHAHSQPFAAHICHVWNDNLVNLHILREDGTTFARTSCVLAQGREANDGECGWMPFQLGQAAKGSVV